MLNTTSTNLGASLPAAQPAPQTTPTTTAAVVPAGNQAAIGVQTAAVAPDLNGIVATLTQTIAQLQQLLGTATGGGGAQSGHSCHGGGAAGAPAALPTPAVAPAYVMAPPYAMATDPMSTNIAGGGRTTLSDDDVLDQQILTLIAEDGEPTKRSPRKSGGSGDGLMKFLDEIAGTAAPLVGSMADALGEADFSSLGKSTSSKGRSSSSTSSPKSTVTRSRDDEPASAGFTSTRAEQVDSDDDVAERPVVDEAAVKEKIATKWRMMSELPATEAGKADAELLIEEINELRRQIDGDDAAVSELPANWLETQAKLDD